MKELLYKKSEAVAALNRVDGFHPMELARKIGEEGQEEQLSSTSSNSSSRYAGEKI